MMRQGRKTFNYFRVLRSNNRYHIRCTVSSLRPPKEPQAVNRRGPCAVDLFRRDERIRFPAALRELHIRAMIILTLARIAKFIATFVKAHTRRVVNVRTHDGVLRLSFRIAGNRPARSPSLSQ